MAARARISGLRGALRLEQPVAVAQTEAVADPNAGGGDPNYYNKLISLFPAEALTLYGTGVAIFGQSTLGGIILCLLVLLALRFVANQPVAGGSTHWPAVVVAVVAFLLWTLATDPRWLQQLPLALDQAALDLSQKWAALIGAAWVILAPLFVEPPARQP